MFRLKKGKKSAKVVEVMDNSFTAVNITTTIAIMVKTARELLRRAR
jgi:hypothetical protein